MRLSILLLLVFSAQGLPAQGRFPNIVVVLADDMGWGDPRETKNRYTDEPDTVAELAKLLGSNPQKRKLQVWFVTRPVTCPTERTSDRGRGATCCAL